MATRDSVSSSAGLENESVVFMFSLRTVDNLPVSSAAREKCKRGHTTVVSQIHQSLRTRVTQRCRSLRISFVLLCALRGSLGRVREPEQHHYDTSIWKRVWKASTSTLSGAIS